jgi:hypothetical protein
MDEPGREYPYNINMYYGKKKKCPGNIDILTL